MTIQAKRAPGSAIAGDPMGAETIRRESTTRKQQLRAVTAVIRRIPEGRYRTEILEALFRPPGRARSRGGNKAGAEAVVYAARRAWLGRCRAWLRSEGYKPGAQISAAHQRRYEDATGDVWQRPTADAS